MQATLIRHDTKAWKAQVWISFFVAAALCATGLAWLPGRELDRAFMMMGYLFCVSAAFALAKFVRDNERRAVDTPLWRVVVWSGFLLAMTLTGWGLTQMEINPAYKAFLGGRLAVPDLGFVHARQDVARRARRTLSPRRLAQPSVCAACERG